MLSQAMAAMLTISAPALGIAFAELQTDAELRDLYAEHCLGTVLISMEVPPLDQRPSTTTLH